MQHQKQGPQTLSWPRHVYTGTYCIRHAQVRTVRLCRKLSLCHLTARHRPWAGVLLGSTSVQVSCNVSQQCCRVWQQQQQHTKSIVSAHTSLSAAAGGHRQQWHPVRHPVRTWQSGSETLRSQDHTRETATRPRGGRQHVQMLNGHLGCNTMQACQLGNSNDSQSKALAFL
jgi:hypothetical protein